jgi:hypothetical protein
MRSTINTHLGADARIAAPEQADGFLEISAEYDTLNLFLGFDDETRVTNIDKIAEALLEIRIRCLQRMVKEPEQADPITASKGATERESWTDAG